MKPLLTFYLVCLTLFGAAQNRNSVWCFGDSAGIDFSSGIPVTFESGMDGRGSCASIADTNGSLLFYAFTRAGVPDKTTRIFDKSHQIMQGGDSIIGEAWYRELVIIPMQNNIYYLFSISITFSSLQGLYYSVIDMNQNGGFGAVIQKNIQLNSFRNADCLTAIKHGNGRDWWLITKNSNLGSANKFLKFLITPNGIDSALIQNLNNATNMDNQRIVFNSSGTKFMQLNTFGFLAEFDFDRCTGNISNPNIIFPDQFGSISRYFWDGAYSPDDSKFYISSSWLDASVSDTSRVLQYDLTAADVPASCDTLFTIKHPVIGASIRLGPDEKIYYTCLYDSGIPNGYPFPDSVRNIFNENLGVVNNPNMQGIGCDFQPFSFNLAGKRTYVGLPNNPNYSLGPVTGSVCDSLTTGGPTLTLPVGEGTLFVYYHAGWQTAFVNAQHVKGNIYSLRVTDMLGNVVYNEQGRFPLPHGEGQGGAYFTKDINCTAFAKGLYVVSLQTDKERLVKKFVRE